MMEMEKTILFYDGHCLMCSSLVQWVMKKDKKFSIYFAALQDEKFKDFLEEAPENIRSSDSVILYENGKFFHYSEAVFMLYRKLGFPWNLITLLRIFPLFIRDAIYKFIARYRKRWFGSSDSCYIVPTENRANFLSDPTKNFSDE